MVQDGDGGNDFFFECRAILAVFLTSPAYVTAWVRVDLTT